MPLPSLILVPGAWHRPVHFEPLLDELPDVDVHTVRLESSGDDPSVLGDMHADAAAIAAAVSAVGGPAVVVAHSYGGIPATEALASVGNVRRIVHLAGFQLHVGESLLSSLGGSLPPWCKIHDREGVAHHIEVTDPYEVFYQDVDTTVADEAISRLGYQSYSSFDQALTQAGGEPIPSTYVICENDNALPPAVQEQFAQRATGVVRLRSSHSSFLSHPAKLARILRNELASV